MSLRKGHISAIKRHDKFKNETCSVQLHRINETSHHRTEVRNAVSPLLSKSKLDVCCVVWNFLFWFPNASIASEEDFRQRRIFLHKH